MTRLPRALLRCTTTAALGGFVVLSVQAAWTISQKKHVREFQAGPDSSWSEKAWAIATRASLEGIGCGALGLVLGCVAVGLALSRRRSPGPSESPSAGTSPSALQGMGAGLVLSVAAFAAWTGFGTWFTNEALPFLSPAALLGLNLAGFGAILLGLVLVDAIARRLPFAPRSEPAAVAAGVVLAVGSAAWLALTIVRGESGGWRSPARLAGAAACLLGAIPAAAILGSIARPLVAVLGQRLAAGPLVPRAVPMVLGALLLGSAAVTLPGFSLSAIPADVEYAKLSGREASPGPNVVLVTVDTLRADALGCYGYPRPTSPFLDSLAAAGSRFDDPVSPAAWTKPSTATILTGLYPSRHGALYHGSSLMVPDGGKTLAESFQAAGFVTAGFVSNPNVKKIFAFDRGFDEFFDSPVEDTLSLAALRDSFVGRILKELTRYQFNWKYENDVREMNRHVFSWLQQNHGQRFFLYLHYIDPHEPYSPPAAYEKEFAGDHPGIPLFNERKRKVGRDLYDGEIRYTDEGLKELVAEFQRLGVWENTIFVLTSDHGEEFFEHGALGHGFSLYQEVVRVPLLAHGPGVAKGRVVEGPVQIVDLAATVLDLAGTGIDTLGDGRSFAASMTDPGWKPATSFFLENEFGENDHDTRSFVLSAIREGSLKLVLTERNAHRPPELHGREELYDLAADPGEARNLALDEEHKARIIEMVDRLRRHAEFLQAKGFRHVKPAALSAEVEASLRAVGYLGGGPAK